MLVKMTVPTVLFSGMGGGRYLVVGKEGDMSQMSETMTIRVLLAVLGFSVPSVATSWRVYLVTVS